MDKAKRKETEKRRKKKVRPRSLDEIDNDFKTKSLIEDVKFLEDPHKWGIQWIIKHGYWLG